MRGWGTELPRPEIKTVAQLHRRKRLIEHCGGYLSVLEVCGFNQWLIQRLEQGGCRRVYVIAAPERARQKTHRRDAAKLSELLWISRDRIAAGQQLVHVKEVYQSLRAL